MDPLDRNIADLIASANDAQARATLAGRLAVNFPARIPQPSPSFAAIGSHTVDGFPFPLTDFDIGFCYAAHIALADQT